MSAFATRYNTATIEGLEVFYREAGDPNNPTLLLLHGFPSSSHMFRNLINSLADEYHLVAPDHIGFGRSAMPTTTQFTYSFDRLTEITEGLPRACQTLKQRSAPSVRANRDTGAMLVRAAILSVARLSCQRATQSIR